MLIFTVFLTLIIYIRLTFLCTITLISQILCFFDYFTLCYLFHLLINVLKNKIIFSNSVSLTQHKKLNTVTSRALSWRFIDSFLSFIVSLSNDKAAGVSSTHSIFFRCMSYSTLRKSNLPFYALRKPKRLFDLKSKLLYMYKHRVRTRYKLRKKYPSLFKSRMSRFRRKVLNTKHKHKHRPFNFKIQQLFPRKSERSSDFILNAISYDNKNYPSVNYLNNKRSHFFRVRSSHRRFRLKTRSHKTRDIRRIKRTFRSTFRMARFWRKRLSYVSKLSTFKWLNSFKYFSGYLKSIRFFSSGNSILLNLRKKATRKKSKYRALSFIKSLRGRPLISIGSVTNFKQRRTVSTYTRIIRSFGVSSLCLYLRCVKHRLPIKKYTSIVTRKPSPQLLKFLAYFKTPFPKFNLFFFNHCRGFTFRKYPDFWYLRRELKRCWKKFFRRCKGHLNTTSFSLNHNSSSRSSVFSRLKSSFYLFPTFDKRKLMFTYFYRSLMLQTNMYSIYGNSIIIFSLRLDNMHTKLETHGSSFLKCFLYKPISFLFR